MKRFKLTLNYTLILPTCYQKGLYATRFFSMGIHAQQDIFKKLSDLNNAYTSENAMKC